MNLRLCRSPWCTFPGLVLYQLHKTSLGFPLYTHFVEIVLGVYGLIENLELVRRVYQIYHFVWILSSFSSSSSSLLSSSSLRTGWDVDAPVERLATKSGRVEGVSLGSGIPSGTTNP